MTDSRMTDSGVPPIAVVLLSGGLDSTTVLAMAQSAGYACHALSFHYGQRHDVEIEAARRVADAMGVAGHHFVELDLRSLADVGQTSFQGSALISELDVPKDRDEQAMSADIPVTYVPARNTIFLANALALAEVLAARDIFIGVNAIDYSGYPDCRPEYIEAFEKMANLATKAGVEGQGVTLHTPLITLPKIEIIRRGLELGVDYALTHSCYDPDAAGRPCAHCDSCLLRQRAFSELGMPDPALDSHAT